MYMYQKAACLSMIPEVPDEETRELFLYVNFAYITNISLSGKFYLNNFTILGKYRL